MRTTPLNGILTSLATNFSRRNKDVRLYEIGNIYLAKEQPLTELPDERKKLTLGMYGEGDFYTMKGVVELLLERVGIEDKPVYSTKTEIPYDHPGRRAAILIGGTEVGEIGEIHPKVMKNYGLGERTYVAVLDLKNLIPLTSFDRKYKGLAKYPAVSRDISMVVPKGLTNAEIEAMIGQRGGRILEDCTLFDVYEGAPILPGFKSMAYSLRFRSAEKTLEEAEVQAAMKKILNGLTSLGAELRS